MLLESSREKQMQPYASECFWMYPSHRNQADDSRCIHMYPNVFVCSRIFTCRWNQADNSGCIYMYLYVFECIQVIEIKRKRKCIHMYPNVFRMYPCLCNQVQNSDRIRIIWIIKNISLALKWNTQQQMYLNVFVRIRLYICRLCQADKSECIQMHLNVSECIQVIEIKRTTADVYICIRMYSHVSMSL